MGLTAAAPPPVFHEEFLVVLEPVRRPDDGVVQTVSVEVLEGLANLCFKFVVATICRYSFSGSRFSDRLPSGPRDEAEEIKLVRFVGIPGDYDLVYSVPGVEG